VISEALQPWSPRAFALAAAGSLALHVGVLVVAARLEPRRLHAAREVTEVAFEVASPLAPPPAAALRPDPPPAPVPRAVAVAVAARRVPREVALREAIRTAEPPSSPSELPPPSEPPPPGAPTARAVPRVGITLGSTATGGSFAVGVGNTLYGKASETAADPAEVKPYAGPATPPQRPFVRERLFGRARLVSQPLVPYPPEARKAGVAGKVVLLLRVAPDGQVLSASIVSEPGSGLGEAAREAALRFRFEPAVADGEAIETELRFTYRFILE
jgi:protein TonB